MFRVFHDQRLGDLEFQGPARNCRAAQHSAQILDEIVAQQLPRRDVHAGENRLVRTGRGLPLSKLFGGVVEDKKAQVHNQSDFLGDRYKFLWRQPAELRVIPACQCFEPCNGSILQPHDRLVEHLDLLALDGTAQFGFHRQAVGLARTHGRLEDLDAVAANTLGVVHRQFGVL